MMITLEIVKNIATIIVASIASFVAISGLNTWKKQLRGKNDYELARRYLRAVYEMRNAIRYVRNPWIPIEETMSALKKKGFQESDHSDSKKMDWAVYSLRWEKIKEASSDLEVESTEGEISWGNKAVEILKDLYKLRGELLINVNDFIRKDPGFKIDRDILYGKDNDNFDKKLQQAVTAIESYLKPYLIK